MEKNITDQTNRLSLFRDLSDRQVVSRVAENRYIQYFCNVPDAELKTFMHHTSLSKIRRRLGEEGVAAVESDISVVLRLAGVINGDSALIDSTVPAGNIACPTDIGLIFDALRKMGQSAGHHGIPVENFIGNPGDKKIFADTYDLFADRTESFPATVVTDGGCRSRGNMGHPPPQILFRFALYETKWRFQGHF